MVMRRLVHFNTKLVQNLGHIHEPVFLQLWAQLFQENLGTFRSAKMLERTLCHRSKSDLNIGSIIISSNWDIFLEVGCKILKVLHTKSAAYIHPNLKDDMRGEQHSH